jgi:hypothetical protein
MSVLQCGSFVAARPWRLPATIHHPDHLIEVRVDLVRHRIEPAGTSLMGASKLESVRPLARQSSVGRLRFPPGSIGLDFACESAEDGGCEECPMRDDDRRLDIAAVGHNGGPPLDEPARVHEEEGKYLAVAYCWQKAHEQAWKNLPYDIVMFRLSRAEAAGVSYREYTLEILERGRYLQKKTSASRRRV